MFKFIKIIEDVKKYCISKFDKNIEIVYWTNNRIIYNENVIINGNISNIYVLQKKLIYSINFQKLFSYNLGTNEKKEIPEVDGFSQFVRNNSLLVVKNSDDYLTQYISFLDLTTNEKKWTIDSYFGNGSISDNFLYASCLNNRICKIDLNTPENPLWQFDLTTLGTYSDYNNETQNYKVEKILGIHNERLYLGLSGSLILELDIATGDITYKWHKLPKQFVKHPSDGFSARLFDLDTENNQLICVAGRRYDTIDLGTKTYNSVDTTKELDQFDIVSITRQGDFTNEHISAIAHLKNDTWMQEGIVMFNRKTNKIDFFYKNETFTTGTYTPKLAANKLYQLSLEGTLHIFEKD